MNIILHHTLKSIKKNKGQLAVIITTIIVVTVMIFVSLSLTDLFYNINISSQSRLSGNTDIAMRGGELFSKDKVEDFVAENSGKITSADYFLQTGALLQTNDKTKIVMLEVTDLQKLASDYPGKLVIKESSADVYEYPSIWIAEDFAKELGAKVGDTVDIYIQAYSRFEKMSVSKIMKNQGFFADSNINNILLDFNTINTQGMITVANLKLANTSEIGEIIEELVAYMENEAITIESAVDLARTEQIVNDNTKLLNIALSFIMAMMMLILFTSYLVVAKNRLNEMVIFKAAGATPAQTTLIMLVEVLLYGVVGAAIGLVFGRIAMGLTIKAIVPNFPSAVDYDFWKYAVAFFTGVAVSTISAIFPIIRVSGKSVRELTSGAVKDIKYTKPLIVIINTILLITSILLLVFLEAYAVQLTIVLIILFAFWIFAVSPYVIKFFSHILSYLKQSRLASISIKRNSASQTLATLVGTVITFSFIVISVMNLTIVAIKPFNSRFSCDYVISSTENISYTERIVQFKGIEGVSDAAYYRDALFEIDIGEEKPITYDLIGIDSVNALAYATKEIDEGIIKKFEETEHPIIINYDLALRLSLEIGDKFSCSRQKATANTTYNEIIDYEFTIVGFDKSATENDRVAYIRLSEMTSGGQDIEFESEMIFITAEDSADIEDLFLTLRDTLSSDNDTYVLMFEDWAYATTKGLEGVSALLKVIQIMVSLVAFIGVVNLTIVTVYDRQREFNIYKISGMNRTKYQLLATFEGIIVGASGAVIGIALSFLFNQLMPTFSKLINKYMLYSIFPVEIMYIAFIGIAIYVSVYSLIAFSGRRAFGKLMPINERSL